MRCGAFLVFAVGCTASAERLEAPPPASAAAPSERTVESRGRAAPPVGKGASGSRADACRDDAAEPDDEPNVNQLARWSSLGVEPPAERVACPGNFDFIQGVGDFSMKASVRWNAADGNLSVALVDLANQPYVLRKKPFNRGESMSIERGHWRVLGGTHRHFIRVKNDGPRPIRYHVNIEGIWGE